MISLIVRAHGQSDLHRFEVEDQTWGYLDEKGELQWASECRDPAVHIFRVANGYELSADNVDVSINDHPLMANAELADLRKARTAVRTVLVSAVTELLAKLPADIRVESSLIYSRDYCDALNRLIDHYSALNVVDEQLQRLDRDDYDDFSAFEVTVRKAVEFEDYSRTDSVERLRKSLVRKRDLLDNKALPSISCSYTRLTPEQLDAIAVAISDLETRCAKEAEQVRGELGKMVDSLGEGSSLDELLTHLRASETDYDNARQLQCGDFISIGSFTVEVNRLTGMSLVSRRQNPFDVDMTYFDVDEIFKPLLVSFVSTRMEQADSVDVEQAEKAISQEILDSIKEIRDTFRFDSRIIDLESATEDNPLVLCRAGDFGHTAYYVISGELSVIMDRAALQLQSSDGRHTVKKRGLSKIIAQLWQNKSQVREWRSSVNKGKGDAGDAGEYMFLQDSDAVFDVREGGRYELVNTICAGELVGELSALGRTPRTATILAKKSARVLEIRWQGLRDLRSSSSIFKNLTDAAYRERALDMHLRRIDAFSKLDDADRQRLAEKVELRTIGDFNWHMSFIDLMKEGSDARDEIEPIVAAEGQYPDALILIRSGFARVSREYHHGQRTVSYLGKGAYFGLDELLHNYQNPDDEICFRHSLRAIGYVDVIFIPREVVYEYIFDKDASFKPQAADTQSELRTFDINVDQMVVEELVAQRSINGTAAMLIDMDRCTRCDDCVRGCSNAHDGNPRFIRHGPIVDNFMIANACMHCNDPVCMIGCPTGAIQRNMGGGEVIINDLTCIGCSVCANSCPYDNIRMVNVIDDEDSYEYVSDPATQRPVQKATKCDLCVDQLGGPACVNACPHDALKRVNLSDVPSLEAWLNER
ncbi:MAG: cyclic nucleotide-binding domain-containing protein [Lentisphaeria bacterium]